MKIPVLTAAFFSAALLARADAPKIEWQRGPCLGGNRPATACKTCARCAYCGKQRGPNSATCAVCEKGRAQ